MIRTLRPLLRDLAAVMIATVLAAGAGFFVGVLLPREQPRRASPAPQGPVSEVAAENYIV